MLGSTKKQNTKCRSIVRSYYSHYYYYYYNESSFSVVVVTIGVAAVVAVVVVFVLVEYSWGIISHESGQTFSVELTLKLFVCGSSLGPIIFMLLCQFQWSVLWSANYRATKGVGGAEWGAIGVSLVI